MDESYDRKTIRKKLKQKAKTTLHRDLWGNVGLTAPIILIFYLEFFVSYMADEHSSSTALAITNLVVAIVAILIIAYTQYVQSYQSLKQLRDDSELAQPMQSWFKTYLTKHWQRTLWLSVWMVTLFLIGWGALVFVGQLVTQASFLLIIISSLTYTPVPSFVYWLLTVGITLIVVFAIVYLVKLYKYILVPFIGFNDPSLKGFQLIAKSRQLMVGHRWEIFVMHLSFFWWILLTIVTLGLAGFYTIPYMVLTLAGYFDTLNDTQQQQAELEIQENNNKVQPVVLQPSN